MRMLVTGSRDWDDARAVRQAMLDCVVDDGPVIVVHGDCPSGADAIADAIALGMRWTTERHPADWKTYGKGAGFRRNAEMVALGADICLAFIRDGSRGATHTADTAEEAGIPTVRFKA
jgi:SLOG family YspA-like protein